MSASYIAASRSRLRARQRCRSARPALAAWGATASARPDQCAALPRRKLGLLPPRHPAVGMDGVAKLHAALGKRPHRGTRRSAFPPHGTGVGHLRAERPLRRAALAVGAFSLMPIERARRCHTRTSGTPALTPRFLRMAPDNGEPATHQTCPTRRLVTEDVKTIRRRMSQTPQFVDEAVFAQPRRHLISAFRELALRPLPRHPLQDRSNATPDPLMHSRVGLHRGGSASPLIR